MEWIIKNKEWLFSGIAISIPIALIGWFFARQNTQNQKSGNNSTNIQVGGNLKLGKDKNDK